MLAWTMDMLKVTNFIMCMSMSYETLILASLMAAPIVLSCVITTIYISITQLLFFKRINSGFKACWQSLLVSFAFFLLGLLSTGTISIGMSTTYAHSSWNYTQLITRPDTKDKKKLSAPSLPYLQALARYYFNSSSDHKIRFKRLLAINYYLHSVFYSRIQNLVVPDDFVEIELNQVHNLQLHGFKNENIITNAVSWRNIMKRSNRKGDYRMMKFIHCVYIYSCIQFMVTLSYMIYTQFYNVQIYPLVIACSCYIILELINYKYVQCALLKSGFYSALLLPNWSNQKIRYHRPWRKTVGDVKKMMKAIKRIHYIMFDQYEEIKAMNQYVENEDIAGIISEYAWLELPSYDKIKQFQVSVYSPPKRDVRGVIN